MNIMKTEIKFVRDNDWRRKKKRNIDFSFI